MVMYVLLGVLFQVKGELKYAIKESGGQFVSAVGVQMKMQLYVDNLDIRLKVRVKYFGSYSA